MDDSISYCDVRSTRTLYRRVTATYGKHFKYRVFMLGAMTVVELMDAHEDFLLSPTESPPKTKRKLLWIINTSPFYECLTRQHDYNRHVCLTNNMLRKTRSLDFAGTIVISANAGGAWSPIGDVTTIMLWIKEM